MTNLPSLDSVRQEMARRNYYDYVKYTHQSIYSYTRHGEFICNVLNDAINKRKQMKSGEIPRKTQYFMFSVPAQHGKSMHITETLPSYFLGNFPNEGVIQVSYNSNFASKFGSRNKEKVKEFGMDLFGISVAKDKDSNDEWDIVNKDGKKTRGGMISRGILSGVTGSSLGDLIIIDDPIKTREEANSDVIRDKHWGEWSDSIRRRIHPGGIVILIMTRWHEDDLWGRLLDANKAKPFPWQVYNLPLECDEVHIEKEGNPLGRKLGDPLWPEMYGKEHIEEAKRYPASFNAMDQGRPTSQEGNLFKREWWQYYTVLPAMVRKIISIDATFKSSDTSDFVSIQVWGKRNADMYLIDRVNARMDFVTTIQAIRNIVKKHPDAAMKLVEDKANGSAIVSMLRRELGGIIPINPQGGKVARANAISPHIESGNVYLPQNAPWVHDFVEQCAAFPNGKNDDDVDAMTQALNRFIYHSANIPKISDPDNPTPQEKHRKVVNFMTGGRPEINAFTKW